MTLLLDGFIDQCLSVNSFIEVLHTVKWLYLKYCNFIGSYMCVYCETIKKIEIMNIPTIPKSLLNTLVGNLCFSFK